MNSEDEFSLDAFRREVYSLYIQRGVVPPKMNGPEEKELYRQWAIGKKRIENFQKTHGPK